MGSGVVGDFVAVAVNDVAWFFLEFFSEPALGVAVGDEANVVAVWFLSYGKASFGCFSPDVGFVGFGADWEEHVL